MADSLVRTAALAQERRFEEAARSALDAAAFYQRRQPNSRWLYDAYAAAGKFFQMAGMPDPAIDAFDRCFTVFDRVLAGQANVSLVESMLQDWPELFSRAALAALDAHQPARAVDYAEAGRARLAGRIVAAGACPPGADPSDWEAYRSAWRRLAWQVTDRLLRNEKTSAGVRDAAEQVGTLRRRLRRAGVPSDLLSPVSAVATVDDVVRALSADGTATAVLYAIALDDNVLRPVVITRTGAREVVLSPTDQETIGAAVRRFALELRQAGDLEDADRALERLLDAAASPLASLFEGALRDTVARLLWVPHGALVTVPLAAVPLRDGRVLSDAVALQLAPSLTMAHRALRLRSVQAGRAAAGYVEGRVEDRMAPTEGGQTLLPPDLKDDVAPQRPASVAELRAASAGRDLVLFSCHGIFDWDRPVASYLQLAFDCTMDDLVGSTVFDDGTLVALNTCDAGTVAQDVTNEPVGIPIAMMAGGAHTVLGPSQPVQSLAGVTFCLLVLRRLAAGVPSPEAVRDAVVRMRSLTRGEVVELLREAGHPFASAMTTQLGRRAFLERAHWAFFQHWGGAWQME